MARKTNNDSSTQHREGKYYRNKTEKVLTVNTVKYATTETPEGKREGRREEEFLFLAFDERE